MRLMNADGELATPINLGNPVEITILELARRIIVLIGSRSMIEFRPLPPDDPRQRCPDISRARKLLHWQPKIGFEEGLMRTIAYFERLHRQTSRTVRKLTQKATA
jgi:UDP-glucuronate decarboxylase